MNRSVLTILLVACWATLSHAAEPASRVERLRKQVNSRMQENWRAHRVTAAPTADDGEFLRRVYLDLVGRTPRVAEARAFLDDPSPNKRNKIVEQLLITPAHARHFASMHRLEWLPNTATDLRFMFAGHSFENWLQKEYRANTPADALARKILTAKVNVGQRGRIDSSNQAHELASFYQVHDLKPENMAATVSRVFVGIKLECAQCHDHPFAPYTRQQFWEFAAFFGEFTPLPPISPSFVGPLEPQYLFNRLTIPNTTREVAARHFDGREPNWDPKITPREELANWLTSPENLYFARNIVNRLWAQFFGIGLIDPVDEPGEANPPSHPELLDDLAATLIEAKFNTRVVIQALLASDAYQRTSRQTDASQADPRRFARASLRNLSASQIYESFRAATGMPDDGQRNAVFFSPNNTFGRFAFRQQFPQLVAKPTKGQTSILQALLMMNGQAMTDQTSLNRSGTLAAILDAPFMDTPKRLETLYLAAFTRKPTPEELDKFSSYVDRGGPNGDTRQALADVFWVLLNSPEFLLNR